MENILRSEIKPRTQLRRLKLKRTLIKPQCSSIAKKCVPIKTHLSERYLINMKA